MAAPGAELEHDGAELLGQPGMRCRHLHADARERCLEAEARLHAHQEQVERVRKTVDDLPLAAVGPSITARALADLTQLLDWASPFLSTASVCIFPKGAKAEEELTTALRVWKMTVERRRSVTDPTGLILRLSQLEKRGQT